MTVRDEAVRACCGTLYGSPVAELLVGGSFHPGGLDATRALLRSAALPPGARLLDIGCGLGTSARLAADEFGLRVTAIDASHAMVDRARDRHGSSRVHWQVAALPALPFEDGTFDATLAECVLSTMDRATGVPELARVTRRGGVVLISDVVAAGIAIPAIGHRLVGAALCITDAWAPGEIDRRLATAGVRVVARADRSHGIIELADRVEARIGVVRVAARDLGLDLRTMVGSALDAPEPLFSPAAAAEAIEAVRSAVLDGSLRYVTVTGVRNGLS